jgi:hypothetical protein
MNELVPSVSIENLVQKRDAAAERIRQAAKLLREANELNVVFFGPDEKTVHHWMLHLSSPDSARYRSETNFCEEGGADYYVKRMDAAFWDELLERSGLKTFMDAATRERWRNAIKEAHVPELTLANITATFGELYEQRGEMFERGVVAFFHKLSWDYKTNSPVKLGKRLVLTHACGVMGNAGRRWFQGV